jgi:A/G-specific adenine glycosylase
MKPAGDVVHVFSHIKKTYRVQWVVLEGGGNEPPELSPDVSESGKGKGKSVNGGKRKRAKKKSEESDLSEVDGPLGTTAITAKWTPLEQVADAK